jgi:TolB-like protein
LLAFAAAGWAAVEILLGIAGRFGMPPYVDRIVLGVFVAGLVATGLLLRFRPASRVSPPVRVAGVLAITVLCASLALGLVRWFEPDEPAGDVASIAVLPCKYHGDPAYAYLGNGLAEEVHARLARTANVHVPSSRSVRKAMGATPDRAQLARYLRVENLADCSIEQRPGRVSLSAEVVAPESRKVVWSGNFQYASVDPLELVTDLTNSIVAVMADHIGRSEAGRVHALPTANRAAYEHYVQAKQAAGKSMAQRWQLIVTLATSAEGYEQARRHYQSAIEIDADFSAAYAGLALLMAANFERPDADELHKQARPLAERALALNPCEVDALVALSYPWVRTDRVLDLSKDEWLEIRRLVNKAVECEPNNVEAWHRARGMYQSFQFDAGANPDAEFQRMGQAIARAYELDPADCQAASLYLEFWGDFGTVHNRIANMRGPKPRLTVAETVESLRTIMALDPSCGHAYAVEMNVFGGRFAEAIAWGLQWLSVDPGAAEGLALIYLELGLMEQAGLWECRARRAAEGASSPDDCASRRPRPEIEPALRGDRTPDLKEAKDNIEAARAALRRGEPPPRPAYMWAIQAAMRARSPDLAAGYLAEGLRALKTDDPADLLYMNPKRTFGGRNQAHFLAMACRAGGREDDARRLIELARRVPGSTDPEVFTGPMDSMVYYDAQNRVLAGDNAEAIRLIHRAATEHQAGHGWFLPSRTTLLLDPILDPLRRDPVYAPQLQQVIDAYEAWLAPRREKVLEAEAAGRWETLRTFPVS